MPRCRPSSTSASGSTSAKAKLGVYDGWLPGTEFAVRRASDAAADGAPARRNDAGTPEQYRFYRKLLDASPIRGGRLPEGPARTTHTAS
jgi:hypothetical protein